MGSGRWGSSIFGGWDGEPVEGRVTALASQSRERSKTSRVIRGTEAVNARELEQLGVEEQAVSAVWEVGDTMLDLYRVEGVLGAGAMGTVYRVRHLVWEQDLAVKSPNSEMLAYAGGKDAFVTEAETWVGLGLHPHIVTCYYVRLLGGIPRVFAEYVDGGNLAECIRDHEFYRGGPDEVLARILDVSIQIAWALGFAHERGLVHQDVKPANVMTVSNAGSYVSKVTDFGLASSNARPNDSVVGGTFEYFSPEQAHIIKQVRAGRKPSACTPLTYATDIWSWGVCVLDMFAGGQACGLGGGLAAEVLENLLGVGSTDGCGVEIPERVADLLRRCFRKDPAERPASMREVADYLARLYEEVTGKPYGRQMPRAGTGAAAYLNNRALSYLDLGREKEALAAWQAALAADPQHPETTFNRGVYLWRMGKLTDDALIQQLRSVQQFHQGDWVDEYLLGLVHLERGDRCAAASVLREAMQLSSGDPEVRKAVALVEDSGAAADAGVATLGIHNANALSTALSADGKFVLSGAGGGEMTLRPADGNGEAREFKGHQWAVKSVCFSHDGKYALSGGEDCTVRLWDVSTGACRRSFRTRLAVRLSLLAVKVLSVATYWVLTLIAVGAIMLGMMYFATGIIRKEETQEAARQAEIRAKYQYYKYPGTVARRSGPGSSLGSFIFFQLISYLTWALFVSFIALFVVYFLGILRKLDRAIHHLNGHKGAVNSVRMSRGGDFAVSASADKTIRVWDVKTGRRRHTFQGHWSDVTEVCLSGDDRRALSASWDGTVAVWDLEARSRISTFEGHTGGVNCVCLTHDDLLAVSGSSDNTLRLWDVETGRSLRQFVGHTQAVACVAVSADDRFVVSGGWDRSIRLWEIATGRCVHTIRDLKEPALSISLSPDGNSIVYTNASRVSRTAMPPAGGMDVCAPLVCRVVSTVDVLRVEEEVGEKLGRGLEALDHSDPETALALVGEARGYEGYERTPEALDAWARLSLACHRAGLTGVWAHRILDGHVAPVSSVNVNRDGRVAISAGVDSSLRVWEVATGYCIHSIDVGQQLTAACLSAGGTRALSGEQNPFLAEFSMRLWDVEHGRWLKTFYGHEATVSALCMTGDEKFALSASTDGTLRVWDVETARCLRVVKAHKGAVTSVCLTPDERHAVTAGTDGRIHLWELSTGRRVRTLAGHEGVVTSVCVSDDGRLCLSGSADRTVKVWEIKTGSCVRTLEGHGDGVSSVAVSADGRFAVSGGHDCALCLWEVETGRKLQTIGGHEDAVGHVCLSSDGRYAFSASADKSVRLWNLDWRLEARARADWDDGATPFLEHHLMLRCPYLTSIPDDGELSQPLIRRALTRDARPSVGPDHEELTRVLARAGYGWLRPEGVRRRVEEVARDWRCPQPSRWSPALLFTDALSVLMSYSRLVRAKYMGRFALLVLFAILLAPLLYFLVLYVWDMRHNNGPAEQTQAAGQATPTPTPRLSEVEWQSHSPVGTGVSLELPCVPVSRSLPMAYDARVMKSAYAYACQQQGFEAAVSRINFASALVPFTPRKMAESVAQKYRGTPGVLDFNHRVEPFKNGVMLSASYTIDNEHVERRVVVVNTGASMRSLDLFFHQNDDDAAQAARRVLDSLVFE